MADLNGTTIAATYTGLLKTSDSGARGAEGSADQISDGRGNNTPLYLSATEVYALGSGTGTSHTAFGKDCGVDLGAGTGNALFGEGAGADMTTGEHNTAIGYRTLFQGTTETNDNVAVGFNAMSGAWTTAAVIDCVVIGSGAGAGDLTAGASGATLIGKGAGAAVTGGGNNTAIGFNALNAEDGNSQNTAIGYQALLVQNGADSNTVIGNQAGKAISTGGDNTIVGTNAGLSLTTGTDNVAIGAFAFDAAAVSESDNVAIGANAMGACDQGTRAGSDINQNVCIGTNAGLGGDFGDTGSDLDFENNIAIGYLAMDGTGTIGATQNTFIGVHAGGGSWATAISTNNVGIGNYSLGAAMNGALYNTACGYNAGGNVTTGKRNTLIGSSAGANITTGELNVAIGPDSMLTEDDGDRSIAVGYQALYRQNVGAGTGGNIAIGYQAGYENVTGTQNTFLGYVAGSGGTGSNGNSTGLGSQALFAITTGSDNTAVGRESGLAVTSGGYNTLLGSNSATALQTGSNNVVVGYAVNLASDQDGALAFGRSFTAASNANLITFGNGSATLIFDLDTGGATTITSDKRLKENIVDTPLGLNFIEKLKPVQFTRKAHADWPEDFWNLSKLDENDPERTSTDAPTKVLDGLLAQDVKEVMSELGVEFSGWHEEEETTKQFLAYERFIAPLIKSIQELSAKVKALEDAQ